MYHASFVFDLYSRGNSCLSCQRSVMYWHAEKSFTRFPSSSYSFWWTAWTSCFSKSASVIPRAANSGSTVVTVMSTRAGLSSEIVTASYFIFFAFRVKSMMSLVLWVSETDKRLLFWGRSAPWKSEFPRLRNFRGSGLIRFCGGCPSSRSLRGESSRFPRLGELKRILFGSGSSSSRSLTGEIPRFRWFGGVKRIFFCGRSESVSLLLSSSPIWTRLRLPGWGFIAANRGASFCSRLSFFLFSFSLRRSIPRWIWMDDFERCVPPSDSFLLATLSESSQSPASTQAQKLG